MRGALRRLLAGFADFCLTLVQRRFLILEMARREIAQNQIGSLLGFLWTFVNPVVLICILWMVFTLGFKSPQAEGFPFVVWLTTGLIIWNCFAEALSGGTASVRAHPHLVKKVLFPLSILPVVRLVASLLVHGIFLLLLVLLILAYGLPFSLWWLQAFYYLAAMAVLALGLSWITSALFVFVKDTGQVIAVMLQFGFWATPIFWNLDMMPPRVRFWLKLNPAHYLVQGYRDSFLNFVPFWQHPAQTLYFWSLTLAIFVLGALIFQRLKSGFADVL
jgi:lipopolysaccharide transport system permease protein/teichoic acid transport system permease protein